ncbi:MAG TPA: Xaa-Pro peptidase family protein, partial [Aeromicrobium sp.]|nr:Xaa-Pro peptidase family protein [Aeromicrobium sp.]
MIPRWARAQLAAAERGIDALVITPGADLRYLTGYDAKPLERLTALVLPAAGDPLLVVPELERSAALASGVEVETASWPETDDPFALVAERLAGAPRIAVDDHMWGVRLLTLQERLPEALFSPAGQILAPLRSIKQPDEVAALREAAHAIDRVHARMGEWLRPGRTEREVAADIARAIVDEGHVNVDFVIVGSGPNGASPHHEVSDRRIDAGEPVVVDIGGTMPSGYCSDSTRNYVAGGAAPVPYTEAYAVLAQAQEAQRTHARAGVTAESVDEVGRAILRDAGYGDLFIHRTGHGIGLETHEEPYIVAGNQTRLAPGMAFSIEPGFYIEGRYGARIEDIVVVTEDGLAVLNQTPRDL